MFLSYNFRLHGPMVESLYYTDQESNLVKYKALLKALYLLQLLSKYPLT